MTLLLARGAKGLIPVLSEKESRSISRRKNSFTSQSLDLLTVRGT